MWSRSALARLGSGIALCFIAGSASAIQQGAPVNGEPPQFVLPALQISSLDAPARESADGAARARANTLPHAETAQLDRRTGRFVTLMPGVALMPGRGAGNTPAANPAPFDEQRLQAEAWQTLRGWLVANADALALNVDELDATPRVTVIDPDYVQIYSTRTVGGIRVRDAMLMATIKYGNLVLLGMNNWGDVPALAQTELGRVEAQAALAQRVAPLAVGEAWKASELVWVPVMNEGIALEHRLAWLLRTRFGVPNGRYESLVDARTGEVLSIQDTTHHAETPRNAVGGVYPLSNDGAAPNGIPDGIEQAGWPLPHLATLNNGVTRFTNNSGRLAMCLDGNVTASLSGRYVTMNDSCGASSLTSPLNLDFGTSGGIDCTVPATGGGAGNTHSSRTAYYELNRVIGMARTRLPANTWLRSTLTANVNVNSTCNAGWDGSSVTFFRSGGGCSNTGEIAAVFDHEWGHGLDNNDAVPSVSSPGEGIADTYAALRLNDSCIGRNFRPTNCSGDGASACTACTGVRDIDWARHVSNSPFTLANADASCSVGNTNGPCGGNVHCEGQVYSQAVWDLWNRDLVGAPFNLDRMVSREVASQLTFRGAGGVASWFTCTAGTNACSNPNGCGCAATGGYLQYLAADDDNGNLADGTPHMQAINAAFARHGIACTVPAVTNSGCAVMPTQAPVVTTSVLDGAVNLSWTTSAGATAYNVYRSEGLRQCDYGKDFLGTVTGTTFLDPGLANGRPYSYLVVPVGSSDECFAVASTCATATPIASAAPELMTDSATFGTVTGDGDVSIDNCEVSNVTLPFSNTGIADLVNLRILSVSSPTHPGTQIVTPMPIVVAATQPSCALSNGNFEFIPQGLTPGQTITFEITYTADSLGALTRTAFVSTTVTESDFTVAPSKTFTFETDAEGWVTRAGTFQRDTAAGGGADATLAYMRSSTQLDNQCDVVVSPPVLLSADSTMTLSTRFNIEAQSGGQWWDRANASLVPADGMTRTLITPSGGRAYNASGAGGACDQGTEAGWAGAADSWAVSTWTSTALKASQFAGQPVQLELRYGTDFSVHNFGFRFDQVTLTNVGVRSDDTQNDTCTPPPDDLFLDGFE